MNTSCKSAIEPAAEPATRPFPYADLPPQTVVANLSTPKHIAANPEAVAEQTIAAARASGRQEGEAVAARNFEARLTEVREGVRAALQQFASERTAYYQQVETEVVRLALSIARKILHREAQVDPLLLAGMVKVALQKIEDGTKVVMRTSPQQVSEYRTYFAQHMESREIPEVLEDPNLGPNHCILQTSLGTTELGLEVQLKEIEQGLFDLMQRRPLPGD